MKRPGAPMPPSVGDARAASTDLPTGEPDGAALGSGSTPTIPSRSGRVSLAQQQHEEGARSGGVTIGFCCLALFAAAGVFGLVRSRTAVIALAGDEAPDDSTLGRLSGRFGSTGAPVAGLAAAAEQALPPAAGESNRGAGMVPVVPRKLRFHDGSVAILRSPDTVLEPVSVESRRIVSVLREGAARFEVTRRPGRLFRVIAGDVIVEVLGTRFELERVGDRLRVTVNEGGVRVSWTGGERRLGRGASELFPPAMASRRIVQAEARQGSAP